MEINLVKKRGIKLQASVIPYKKGFRASITIKYKDGTTERIQKYSSVSPERAEEKLYIEASKKYFEHLKQDDERIVFAPTTNEELIKIEKDIPDKVVAETKYNLLFENVAQEWLAYMLAKTDRGVTNRGINNTTFEYYRTMTLLYLVKDYTGIKVTDLTLDIVQKSFDEKVNLKHKTLKGLRTILGQILQYSINKGYIRENFAEKIELPEYVKPDIDFYNEREIKEFKDVCLKDGRAIAMLFYFEVALGLRPEEACGLKWSKIKFSKSEDELAMANINNAVKIKNIYNENHKIIKRIKVDDILKTPESKRKVPINKEDEKVLLDYKDKQMKKLGKAFREDGYIFLNCKGDPYTSEILTNKMPIFLEKYNLPHITPYGLRHSFASLMAKLGIKENILKTLMGHTEISTTHKYYIHLTDDDIMQEVYGKVQVRNDNISNNGNNDNNKVTEEKLEKLEEMMKELLKNQKNV